MKGTLHQEKKGKRENNVVLSIVPESKKRKPKGLDNDDFIFFYEICLEGLNIEQEQDQVGRQIHKNPERYSIDRSQTEATKDQSEV